MRQKRITIISQRSDKAMDHSTMEGGKSEKMVDVA